MKRFISKKLNRKGMSLTETLVTVLLISIIFIAVTSGISVVQHCYNIIVLKADALSLMSTVSMSIDADMKDATAVSTSVDGVIGGVEFLSDKRKYIVSYVDRNPNEPDKEGMIWLYSRNAKGSRTPGTAGVYIPVATDKTVTDKLTLELSFPDNCYHDKTLTYTITIKNKQGDVLKTNTFIVNTAE